MAENGKEPPEPQRPRMKLSEFLALVKEPKNAEKVRAQIAKIPIGQALRDAELKERRVNDVAREKLMGDYADNTTASWRRNIKLSVLARTHTLVESELYGGIIHAPHRETEWPWGIILMIVGVAVAAVTLIYIQPITYWVKTVLLPDPVEQYAVAAFVVFLIILGIIWFRRRKKG